MALQSINSYIQTPSKTTDLAANGRTVRLASGKIAYLEGLEE